MIQDTDLKKTVKEFLNNPPTDLNANCLPLEMCPAGAYHHHNYEGGLVQHTISVIKISLTLCHLIEDNYGGQVNRDIVLAGSILHDIMKCYCYEKNPEGNFRTSEFGEKIDHLSLMVSELMKRDFSTDIIHIIASHHGEISPVKPKTVEALIVSIADQADSELNGKILRAAEYLLRRAGKPHPKINSSEAALKIVKAKNTRGWEALEKYFVDVS